jgi:glycosyltransferase involved in cell wall biosynthesis
MSQYVVSIVVCTYNRANILKYALQSLGEQTAPKNIYEVIVVNNNSIDNTEEIAQEFAKEFRNYHVLQEKMQGLSHARNRGFKEAKADYVAYLDDDAIANKDYVDRIIWVVNNFDFDAFGGRYVPWYLSPKPQWFRDEYGSNGCKLKAIGELKAEFISGGVSVFKKSVLERFGGFPTTLGMSGKRVSYGEETKFQIKMRRAGLRIGFDPDLVVGHLVNNYKYSLLWFFKSAYSSGRDSWEAFDIKPLFLDIIKNIMGIGFDFIRNIINYTPKLSHGEYYIQNWCIDIFCPSLYRIGAIASAIKILTHSS